ncbi:MAG: spore cortex biosynthesis protein YabQ [Ruminococcus sp.]|nr:spore cortex biosynthesis protein YabQ [Ruminococcus sp.]
MEFTLLELVRAFGVSVVVGIGLAVLYEPFRIFHKLGFAKSAHYFITDFLFMIICAFITYFVCLVLIEGCVRLFIIAGEVFGFFLFYYTIRRILDKIYDPVIKISKKFTFMLLKNTRKVMYNIYVLCRTLYKNIALKVNEYVWKKKARKGYPTKRIRKRSGNKTYKEKT